VLEVPWASSLRAHRDRCPNNLLYWSMIRWAIAQGFTVFDFGRSTPGEGTFQFKRQWGANAGPMTWEYWLARGDLPDQSPANAKFRAAIRLWQRLPLAVTNRVGPAIVRNIP
jgi:serine/alanine adding enzyme